MKGHLLAYLYRGTSLGILLLGLQIFLETIPVRAAEAKPPWQVEWDKTMAAAEKEGKVMVYVGGGEYRKTIEQFQKAYPKIKLVTFAVARGPAIAKRLMAERRAEKYVADVYMTGLGTHIQVLYPGKAHAPLRPSLILPEVKDESKWLGGNHLYIYPEEGFSFVFEATVRHPIFYNTNLVKPDEVTSWSDLLNPKWKGKIVSYDPKIPGTAAPILWYHYKNPSLGPEFIGKFYAGMEVTLSRNYRQLTDWLATGKAAICLSCGRAARKAIKQGLPVGRINHFMKEGSALTYGQGIISLIDRRPHPNAAKVFVNWLLSRKGQMTLQEITARSGNPRNSLRTDISKDTVPREDLPKKGVRYFKEGLKSAQERREAVKILKKVMKK